MQWDCLSKQHRFSVFYLQASGLHSSLCQHCSWSLNCDIHFFPAVCPPPYMLFLGMQHNTFCVCIYKGKVDWAWILSPVLIFSRWHPWELLCKILALNCCRSSGRRIGDYKFLKGISEAALLTHCTRCTVWLRTLSPLCFLYVNKDAYQSHHLLVLVTESYWWKCLKCKLGFLFLTRLDLGRCIKSWLNHDCSINLLGRNK